MALAVVPRSCGKPAPENSQDFGRGLRNASPQVQERELAYHPINLTLRFLLELAALAAFAMYGWRLTDHGVLRVGLAFLLPVIAASLWGAFAVPGDPSRSGSALVPVPGAARLILELVFFAAAAWALSGRSAAWAAALAGVAVIHYALSLERVVWLVRGGPA